jgi:hypothetical protein
VSRATITEIHGAGVEAREALRRQHGVRLVEPAEEGSSIQQLPDGVYGFTHSPAIAAPLFRTFRYRAFEMHRVGGEALIVAYVAPAEAERLRAATGAIGLTVHHDREGDADTLIVIPYSRIARHRQYSVRNTEGLELELLPPAQAS